VADNSHLLKTVAADSSLALITSGLAVPFAYLTNLAMARIYGAEAMGTFYLALSLITILAVLSRLGLDIGLLRFVATCRAHHASTAIIHFFWPALCLATLLSCLAGVGLFLVRPLLSDYLSSPHLPAALSFMALALPLSAMGLLLRETVRALGGVRLVVIQTYFITPVGFLILVVSLAAAGTYLDPASAISLAFLLVTLLGLGVLWCSAKLRRSVFRFGDEVSSKPAESFGDLLTYSWPIYLGGIFSLALSGLDSLILGYFTSPATVAYYNSATKTAPLVMLPLVAVNAVVPPLFARFHAREDMASLEMVSRITARWTYFAALPLALLLILLGPELLGFFGPDFRKAHLALSLLALAQLVNVGTGSVGFILNMTGHQRTLLIIQIIVGVSVVPLSGLLAAGFGLTGTAVAHALGLAGLNILMTWGVWRRLSLRPYVQKVGWANLAGLVGSALFLVSKPFLGPWGGAVLFALGYLALVVRPLFQSFYSFMKRSQWQEV
jgi:O-antigen/teichoic acid export membrane protein